MSGFDRIPAELQALDQWVVWKWGPEPERGKKRKKPPYPADAPDGPRRASNEKAEDWTTFEQTVAVVEAGKADGIGFALTEDDPYTGLDLDEEMSEFDQAAVVLALDSYTERSVSGTGQHVVIRASLNGSGRHPTGIGVFDRGRFLYFTGEHVVGTPATVEARQAELEAVLEQYLPKPKPIASTTTSSPVDLDDQELLERMFASKIGDKIRRLWNGDWSEYPSHSQADQALCN